MTILIFKIFWLAALTVFVIFISDHRKKSPSTRPLINRKLILLTKCCYPVPIVACAYAVATAEQIGLADWIALSVTISGCVLTIGAKIQLGGGTLGPDTILPAVYGFTQDYTAT